MSSSPNTVRLGLIQSVCVTDTEVNLQTALDYASTAVERGAQIVCLPEMYRSRYFCQTEDHSLFDLAEPIPGPSTHAFQAFALKHQVVMVVPIFEKRAQGLYHNSAVVIDADGSIAGIYRKMHIPDDPCFYEKFYFTPGDLGFRSFDTKYGRIGVLICWDQWFPEAARLTALTGAQILFYPTAIGFQDCDAQYATRQREAWQTVQRGHAISNGVFVASVNRFGREDALQFWGNSFVSDPFGAIIAQGSNDRPEILLADCNLNLIEETRRNWPFLRDRRVDAYSNILKLYDDEK